MLYVLAVDEVGAQLIGAGVTAAGLLLALWIALYGDEHRAKRKLPLLTPRAVIRRLGDDRNVPQYAVALVIENASGKETARNVEILVVDAEHHPYFALQQPPKTATTVVTIQRSLEWSDGSLRTNVHPGLRRELVVADIHGLLGSPDEPPAAHLRILGHVLPLTVPDDDSRYGFPVPYFSDEMKNAPVRLRLAIIADNVNAGHYTLELRYPWGMPWYAQAGLGAVAASLVIGHTERSADPHLLAGGPWGDLAMSHDPEEWRQKNMPPSADAYALVITDSTSDDREVWRSASFDDDARAEAARRLAEYQFEPEEQTARLMVLVDDNLMEMVPQDGPPPRYAAGDYRA